MSSGTTPLTATTTTTTTTPQAAAQAPCGFLDHLNLANFYRIPIHRTSHIQLSHPTVSPFDKAVVMANVTMDNHPLHAMTIFNTDACIILPFSLSSHISPPTPFPSSILSGPSYPFPHPFHPPASLSPSFFPSVSFLLSPFSSHEPLSRSGKVFARWPRRLVRESP